MLKIWGRRTSSNVQKVMWLVAELGLEHERIDAGGKFGGLDTPEFRQLNPHGRIPVLEDGETVVWESHAILRYLAAASGDGRFWPADPALRAQSDQWIEWTQTGLQRSFMDLFWGYYRTPEPERDPAFVKSALERTNSDFQLLDKLIAGREYLVGDSLSLSDIPAGTTLYRYFEMEILRPSLPNIEAWYTRLQKSQAYRDHVMVPFDELFGRRSF
ncbi:glutathione S-transferase family protein [Pelagibius sp. Alg239-R121]|uniref:glutathione S-transferase family protein n=1 Tax=Pelagibius sp. Alg239-R121 TaxID=2993448 RepID=UPI0024A70BD0|nr:glutathione S-transferase N-terminal domain-containing protein [Pelagibius sp. Alg239-R121]